MIRCRDMAVRNFPKCEVGRSVGRRSWICITLFSCTPVKIKSRRVDSCRKERSVTMNTSGLSSKRCGGKSTAWVNSASYPQWGWKWVAAFGVDVKTLNFITVLSWNPHFPRLCSSHGLTMMMMMMMMMMMIIQCTAARGDLGGPCDASGQCSNVNAVCLQGSCVCSDEYFQRNNTCGMQ